MSPGDVDRYRTARAAYIHVPFCSAVCPYCDFAVVAGADHLANRYLEAVAAEMAMAPALGPLDSVFVGGGTPSLVDPELLGSVVGSLLDRHGAGPDPEITLEANPEDVELDRPAKWREAGFNRISLGAQSFDPLVLAALGRRHDGHQVESAVARAVDAGFPHVSLDLIFGSPVETASSWEESLTRAIATGVDHVSCYALTVERGTPLARDIAAGGPGPDPDLQAERYERADSALTEAGYHRYEVSNWSRPGAECRYNLVVWAQGEYEAYGNGAHRFREWRRSRNVRRVDAYLDRVERGERPLAGEEVLRGWDRELDRLFVGLRRSAGVGDGPGVQALLRHPRAGVLLEEGVVEMVQGRLRIARPLLGDEVHRLVLDLEPPPGWEEASNPDNV